MQLRWLLLEYIIIGEDNSKQTNKRKKQQKTLICTLVTASYRRTSPGKYVEILSKLYYKYCYKIQWRTTPQSYYSKCAA